MLALADNEGVGEKYVEVSLSDHVGRENMWIHVYI